MAAADLGTRIELILEDDPEISLNALDRRLNGPPPKSKKGKKPKRDWRTYPRQSIAAQLERLRPAEVKPLVAKPKPIPWDTLATEHFRIDNEILSYMSDVGRYSEKYGDDAVEGYYALRKLQIDKGIDLLGRLKILILKFREYGSDAKIVIAKLKMQEKDLEEVEQTIEREWEKLEGTAEGQSVRREVAMKELNKAELKAPFSHFVL